MMMLLSAPLRWVSLCMMWIICTELTALGWPTCSLEMGLYVHDEVYLY